MSERVKPSTFQKDSYSDRCNQLIDSEQPWKRDNSGLYRSVTRAEYPYRYWIVQEAEEKRTDILRRRYIEHHLFKVAFMSANVVGLEGRRELGQYWILQPPEFKQEQTFFTHNFVRSPEEEAASGDYKESLYFAIENNLSDPNSEDLLRLDHILDKIHQDGAEPIE